MRARVVLSSLLVLGVVSALPVSAGSRRGSADEKTIARIMALAETDLQLRRADLGLVGSTLPAVSPEAALARPEDRSRAESAPAEEQPAASSEAAGVPVPAVLNR